MRVLGIFYRVCAETAIKELPVKNLTPPFAPATSISYKTDAFPLPSDVTGYIRCFCATTSHILVTMTFDLFDLESVPCTVHLMSDPRTNFYYPTTIGY